MAFNLQNLFRPTPRIGQPVNPATQGLLSGGAAREAYLQHIQDSAMNGQPALPWEEWMKQQLQQQPQLGQ
jgi:hypothetical protein